MVKIVGVTNIVGTQNDSKVKQSQSTFIIFIEFYHYKFWSILRWMLKIVLIGRLSQRISSKNIRLGIQEEF